MGYIKQRSFLVVDDGTNLTASWNGTNFFQLVKSDGELRTKAGIKGGQAL